MPTPDGKLTLDEQEKFKEWIKSHGGPDAGRCGSCSSNNWSLLEHVLSIPLPGILGVVPAITILCQNCGMMRLYNGVHVGVFPGVSASGGTSNAS